MKTLLGIAAVAALAFALPASAAEHAKKHDANAKPAAASVTSSTPAAPAKKESGKKP
jgi:hypothetical protein